MGDIKSIFTSKTFWVNVIVLLIGLLTQLGDQPWIPPATLAFLTSVILPMLNIFLRWLSDEPVRVLPKKR